RQHQVAGHLRPRQGRQRHRRQRRPVPRSPRAGHRPARIRAPRQLSPPDHQIPQESAMSFTTSLSGINAANADLNVTSNNIANASTVGFKTSRAEFADLFSTTSYGLARNAIGSGVKVSNIAQQFAQGNIDPTGRSLDFAIDG